MKPDGTRKLGSAGGAVGTGAGVPAGVALGCGLGVAGAVVGVLVGAEVGGAPIEPGCGCWTIGCALVAPPPLHAASAQASNAAPTSEPRRRWNTLASR
jgi:phage tail tape-measure protein